MLEIIAMLLPGLLMVGLARLNWKKHVAKFGPPPPGHHWGTFAFFLVWSSGVVMLGGQLFAEILGVAAFVYAFDSLTLDLIRLPKLESLPWSRKQQARDGFMLAVFFTFPILFLLRT